MTHHVIFALESGCILSWNAGAARFKGDTADEIIWKHSSVIHSPEKQTKRFPE